MPTIRLAISTCPNDTFAFHGLLTKQVNCRGINFEIQLLDIQQLNDGLFDGRFDVAKASFHAAALLSEKTIVLPSGSALGFGVGPLLLSANNTTTPSLLPSEGVTLCPGQHTTATMLFRLFYGMKPKVEHVVFSDIMPRLKQKSADFGVCIHEGRFTWQEQQLGLIEDLGSRWEKETESPLPLGGILANRNLDATMLASVQQVIHDSLQYSLAHRDEALLSMRNHAQEFDDEVLMQHVDLYVNQWTVDLGDVGRKALATLSEKAIEVGLIDEHQPAIEVLS